MSNDVSKVYQFLSTIGDWKTKADKNGDGTIIKSEFRSFMEDNYEWDGETTDAGKNDLINSFWKAIDTNQGGKVSGTRYKNKNALDKNEINTMENRIAIYDKLNEYVSEIDAPSEVSDRTAWKKSVSESLANTTETLIQKGVTADNLADELDKILENVKNKTTADYCANEYLNTAMKDIVKEYGYAYADDTTLNGIIDNYIHNLPEDSDSASIRQAVEEIIDAYMATAGFNSDDSSVLATYSYDPQNSSAMNDLQKSVVKTKLTQALEELKNDADYKNNSALYDDAINEYINSVLDSATYAQFEEVKAYGVEEFKASDAGKALEKTVQVKNLFGSDEMKAAITSKLSEAFASRISGLMKGEITAYDEIKAQAIEKAKHGDFDVDGTLDQQKAIDWAVEQFTQRLTEFYPNGLNDMPLSDLGTMYDKLVDSAKANDDVAALKKAAVSYCSSVAKKSTLLAQAVKEVFGNSYTTEIDKLTSGDIETKMAELKAKVDEIGDPALFEVTGWGTLPTELSMAVGGSKSYKLEATVTNGTSAIATDRISYGYNVKSGNAKVSISDAGALTINAGSTSGTSTVEIYTMVDNTKVEPAITIKVTTNKSSFDWGNMTAKYNGYIANGNGGETPNSVRTLGELYNSNGVINLLPSEGLMRGTNWTGAVATAKANVGSFVEMLASNCTATGEYNEKALNTAKQKVIALYETAFDHSLNNWAGKKSTRDNLVEYDGENYGYEVAKYYKNASTKNTDYSAGCSASDNKLGLRISEQYDDHWFQVTVNVKCIMDFFNKFYEQALTA